ncbi:AI-2E family transporter [Komagataeibacter medellinensis]|uniref:Transporter n=2 Tax=Komagataeibacter medellinensis TaxID=1177712 RepID=G2I2W2_KOMMN|nr:AI-2E family transporter [Komagataeibacter medellinensis]KAB8123342.1 AI-2E family transporter [Komagataeibacter medellinensis]BAK85091.1 transporter [Komagataeibacter medellinensis NBRC 3288]
MTFPSPEVPPPAPEPGHTRQKDHAEDPRAIQLARIYTLLRLTLIITIVVMLIWVVGDVLMVIFAATLVAVILHNLAGIVEHRTRMPYWLALSTVVVVLIAALTGLIWSSGPEISEQAVKLRTALSEQAHSLRDSMGHSTTGRMILDNLPTTLGGNEAASGTSGFGSLAGSMTGFVSSAFGAAGTLAVILIAGLYFAISPELYVNGMLRMIPHPYRMTARELLLTAGRTLWAWTAGQALDMTVVGLLSFIGLWCIGVPLALALGVVAGLANFIPYIGAFVGAVPAVLIALSQGTREGFMVMGLYAAIQFFEGNVMAPLIQRHAVQMPPGLTILSQTIFGTILGIPGLILASPLTAALLAMADRATPELNEDERV